MEATVAQQRELERLMHLFEYVFGEQVVLADGADASHIDHVLFQPEQLKLCDACPFKPSSQRATEEPDAEGGEDAQ